MLRKQYDKFAKPRLVGGPRIQGEWLATAAALEHEVQKTTFTTPFMSP